MNIIIRQETKDDFSSVYNLNLGAFGQENEPNLVDALRDSKAFIPQLSIVAEIDSMIVGYILFTKILIRNKSGAENESLALAPMAVDPEHQFHGIGGLLIRHGLQKAKDLGYKSVIVLGHEHYYPKFGFEPAEKWDIKAPFDVPENVFMAIELVEGGLKDVSGVVQYPAEFDAV